MTMLEIKKNIDTLNGMWHEFREINDKRLKLIEEQVAHTGDLEEKMSRINDEIVKVTDRINILENYKRRPDIMHDAQKEAEQSMYIKQAFNPTGDGMTGIFDRQHLISRDFYSTLENKIQDLVRVRKYAHVIKTDAGNMSILIPPSHEKADGINAFWGHEGVRELDFPQKTTTMSINCLNSIITVPKEYILDPGFNMMSWFTDQLAWHMALKENDTFLRAQMLSEEYPRSIFPSVSYDTEQELEINDHQEITGDLILELYYKISPLYLEGAQMLMHPLTLRHVRSLKLSTGQYLWEPQSQTMPETLLGIPVFSSADILPYNTTLDEDRNIVHPIGIFNLKKYYLIADRQSLDILFDPYTSKPNIILHATKRFGGTVMDLKAYVTIKIKKKSN
ncbi:MAG: phage major capsid protein, HK97 family [Candidatus Xenolissoclinum pacificiensis L6]|uniref:Phage major capsid protein, HK97 family n=1 Tax=Candidatus Xenolissoclinum pacificiensis L6 TaxID=1401685 RepID=W2UY68_9RICK|nr:MAG: phage major capsid protein, HK97 family [Candidatus Xenolissoclinum pacificiensis L6]